MLEFELENCYGSVEYIQLSDEECYVIYNEMINRKLNMYDILATNFDFHRARRKYIEFRVFDYITEKEKKTQEYWDVILNDLRYVLKTTKDSKQKENIKLEINQIEKKVKMIRFKNNIK